MSADQLPTCALCGDSIGDGEAWMAAEDGGRAHSGCVYRDSGGDERDRWMPPEMIA
jgi:hypothetical protein